jgi:hypothetical protein
MSSPVPLPSFTSGEIGPTLLGHIDLARIKSSAMTMRNMFVRFQGGASSRAGTSFVGYSKQTGRFYPPRLIPFQFSINQGLALEFGHHYMRVCFDGALVTEGPLVVTGATNAKPCVITVSANALVSATPINTGVVSSYVQGDLVTLAGGTFSIQAQIRVSTTLLLSATLGSSGTGYAPGDTINLAGGTQTSPAVMSVSNTKVVSASLVGAGTGGANGAAIVTGTTGTGTKFQANVTIAGGSITTVNSVSIGGSYTVNPANLNAEPVTGAGLVGATLKLVMGVQSASVSSGGVFTANPAGLSFTQASTSGSGAGATFSFGIFGINSLTIANAGAYTVAPSSPASQASTTGSGIGVTFSIVAGSANTFAVGDWVYLSGIGGMTQINGRTAVIGAITGGGYALNDVFGNPIDSTSFGAFTSAGSAARIYTLATPYAEQDLPWLKFTESADIVSLTCVNQLTKTEYPPYDLARLSDSSWTLTQVSMTPTVSPPTNASGSATSIPYGAGANASYAYAVTAVNPKDGTESIASNTAYILNAVDIAATAGSITITWNAVPGVNEYNIYKAQPTYMGATINPSASPVTYTYTNCPPPPVGSLMGYVGSAYGTQFVDSNTLPEFSQVPPTHQNPFARGQVIGCQPTSGGSGYSTATATITTSTGSGAVLIPVIVNGQVVAYIVQDAGSGYASSDTVTITGDGSGATAILSIGAQSGTYPGVVGYFQGRRVYGYSLNNPDTYFMSQQGSYTNFDTRIPTISSDAITGTPWSVQVNGIQWMISMPGGLVVLTGSSAWQLTGAGGSSLNPQPITPSDQQAQPQAYNGSSPTVPPFKVNYDIIYVQSKGSIYRDLSYQFFTNIYTGTDLTINSPHLFFGHTIRDHAWCEEPYKLLWSVRDDGILLSMTYLKEQQVSAWARHDTNGTFWSACSIVEPPVDAAYFATQRTINGNTAYMLERMDNRIWTGVESTWCVDCGLSLAQPQPAASLNASSASGVGALSGVTGLVGGSGYSASTYASVIDNNGSGPGAGAVPVLTIIGGVITNIAFSSPGAGYVSPALMIVDPAHTGSGASAQCVLNSSVTFTASAPVFSAGNLGSVIRMGGGVATITGYSSTTQVTAKLTTPISAIQPNSGGLVQTQASGTWTMTAPTTRVTGLTHLIGATVTGLADGNVIPPQTVAPDGSITLSSPASAITVGLGFQCQLQSVYLDALANETAGQRKKASMATVRVEASRGFQIGSNQVDGSMVSPPILAPVWQNMDQVPDLVSPPFGSLVSPLWTGDVRVPVTGGFTTPGQIAVQQIQPLPLNVLAIIPEVLEGDQPEQKAQPRDKKRAA